MPVPIAVALPDLLGGALAGFFALELLRVLALISTHAGMVLGATVTLPHLLGGAVFGLTFQILRLLALAVSVTHT
jgi:hypothetical protein